MLRPADTLDIACARCGERAMRLVVTWPGWLVERPDRRRDAAARALLNVPTLGVRTELGTSDLWVAASKPRLDLHSLRALLRRGDVAEIHALYLELVPLYCPACAASYCESHWQTWDVWDHEAHWFEERRGRCPEGHERMLHD